MELPPEYNEYSDVFSNSDAAELPKHRPADHAIDHIDGSQPPYDPIYNLNEVKLETLRGYIESNLANGFIRPSTSPARSPILFVQESGEIKKSDEWKTAFRTRYDHFEYQVLPFGLTNAPATFQAYINQALTEKLDVFCIVYLDGILIYTQDTGAKHVEAMK